MLRVQSEPFDAGAELNAFTAAATGAGAVVSFTGVVRGDNGLSVMEIEHYPGMTEAAIAAIIDEATARFGLSDALVIHRYGPLAVGEPIMMVATAARHRALAFQGAEFLMDYLKSRAPFWKKEDGGQWVQAKDEDEDALARWQD
ncbi:molybdenum cofactor biosynthesis protein MoaE [Stagnihabitans tardus]|uniref:Molybdopterin synthase catalytic subunit n=1 Tax=Stagnihabitans tardus TaxID=2699202 RepID=A0AAE5BWS0_9RHOB|nr:molybdenum cofactor biosynthesis protein MoaE [Stagnihabitans tardus]NBZ89074.1 molybdenum cofactor biosynthesis protein MoaE [Stagnihabitans tardus]